MTPNSHYEVSLEQADGEFALESSPCNYGDATDLYGQGKKRFADTTVSASKWWNGNLAWPITPARMWAN